MTRSDHASYRFGRGAASLAALALACAASLCGGRRADASVASDVLALTGQRTRIVWMRDMSPGDGAHCQVNDAFRLMGLDTTEGVEREISPGPAYNHHPIITPDGTQVMYSDLGTGKVRMVNWDGSGDHEFCSGFVYDVYRDSGTQIDWAIVNDYIKWNVPAGGTPRVRRVRIDNPAVEEVIWNDVTYPMMDEAFDISADGTVAGGLRSHPDVGRFDLVAGTYSECGQYACNTSLAPDNSYLFFHMIGGGHTNVWLYYNYPTMEYRQIFINDAPNVGGGAAECWNPRWGNDARYMTMTAPALVWVNDVNRWNIYIGRFDAAFTNVEAWVQVTDTFNMDAYADSWIGEIGMSAPSITSSAPTDATTGSAYTYTVTASAVPAATFTVSGLPAWLTFDDTDTISGTPGPSDTGVTGTITVTATNAQGSDEQQFVIDVAAAVLAITSSALADATVGLEYSYTIVATGYPTPTIDVTGLPAWLAFDGVNVISGTPDESDEGLTDTITVTATNIDGTETQDFTIEVSPDPNAPSILVTSPDGGEIWHIGTTQRIAWTLANVDSVEVFYSTDDGSNWSYVPGAETIDTSGRISHSFLWTIPSSVSTTCLVRVREYFHRAVDESGIFEIRTVTDGDLDGMDDGWEVLHFGDGSQVGTRDFDGDGSSNFDEFMNGTDPTVSDLPEPSSGNSSVSCAAGAAGSEDGRLAAALGLLMAALAVASCVRVRVRRARAPG